MDKYNLIIIGFVVATFLLALWWTFNTIRRIDNQKNFCAVQLTSMAKLWRKAKYVPEDAKERESLYLYRDFLRKFDENEGRYPVMVKNGKVRCMTRKEYDNLVGQKDIKPFSILITMIAVILAGGALYVNLMMTKTPLIGLGLAVIIPVLELVLAFFIARFNREKNNYREGIFLALKENSVAFLSVTKPFIIVDAYPETFGKKKKPLYVSVGELTEEQIVETRDYIIRQKAAETKVVLSSVDNEREIHHLAEKTAVQETDVEEIVAPVEMENTVTVETPAPVVTKVAPEQTVGNDDEDFLEYDKENLISNLVDDFVHAEVDRAVLKVQKEAQAEQAAQNVEPVEIAPVRNTATVEAPAEDDFSLEAIGQALDAEIAKRSKKSR